MQISRVIFNAIADLLAADTELLAAATAMHVHLVTNDFVPSLDVDIGDLTLADFTGSTPKNCGTGEQQVFNDPVTGDRLVQLLEPAGGFTWECTADPDPAQTVYGYVVTDTANAVVLGCDRLPVPVTISAAGQGITIGNIRIPFTPSSFGG